MIERALMSRLADPPHQCRQWPIHYLIGCHRRSIEQKMTTGATDEAAAQLKKCLTLVRELSVSYIGCILSLQMFPQPREAEERGAAQILDAMLVSCVQQVAGGAVFDSVVPQEIQNLTEIERMSSVFMDDFVARLNDNAGLESIINDIGMRLLWWLEMNE